VQHLPQAGGRGQRLLGQGPVTEQPQGADGDRPALVHQPPGLDAAHPGGLRQPGRQPDRGPWDLLGVQRPEHVGQPLVLLGQPGQDEQVHLQVDQHQPGGQQVDWPGVAPGVVGGGGDLGPLAQERRVGVGRRRRQQIGDPARDGGGADGQRCRRAVRRVRHSGT
jgi:hypothetical protein